MMLTKSMLFACNKFLDTDVYSSEICEAYEFSSKINLKQWVFTNRCNLIMVVQKIDDFTKEYFIASKSSFYYRQIEYRI